MSNIHHKEKDLPIPEIILRGVQNILETTNAQYKVASKKVRQKLLVQDVADAMAFGSQPTAKVLKQGNTVFMFLINTDKRSAYLQAYNADTAEQFVANSVAVVQKAHKELGIDYLSMFGEDKTLKLLKSISKLPAAVGWGMKVQRSSNNPKLYRFYVYIGA